ncbi:hypothetical protein HX866_30645 [Pseudomonas gingeri]|uniref:hypothetical protein n=1 Tax=Pseudomonas gingeri TaxID=117681 RepID=UPI0015A3321A|nr:hypothetical protein [Pseudomonas gingeri]NWA29251.1 hypothetical protein [Pseudomonas gingeri]
MFLNAYVPNEIQKVIGLIENNLDLQNECLQTQRFSLWRAGLSERRTAALGCEAVAKPAVGICQIHREHRFEGRFAPQRGQARSPQDRARFQGF